MDYIHLSDNAARQVIDSTTLFNEVGRVESLSRQYAGGMYWKRQGEYEYLVKTAPDNRQRRIGPRSESTEKIHLEFVTRKAQLESRLKPLRAALIDAERMNEALKAERASVLTNAPHFEQIVIAATGRMALMRTVAPAAFIEFKRWLADAALHRPEPKRRRDRRQADIVQALLDEGLLPAEG